MSFFETSDGVRLSYEDWGTGRPVVLLAGWALHGDMWEYQVPSLLDGGLRCVTMDRRGHGRSDRVGRGYDYDTLVDDVAGLLDHLDLRDVTLVGHSAGAAEVVHYLARHGTDRVARAVLVSSITPFLKKTGDNPEGADEQRMEAVAALLRADRPKYFADRSQGFFATSMGNMVSTELVQWMVQQCLTTSSIATLQLWRSLFLTDFRADCAGITVPTLILHGAADESARIDMTGARTARLVPGNVYEVYPTGGHGMYVTHRDQLNADILRFVSGT